MKFALFDFFEEGTIEVGLTSLIEDLDPDDANPDDFDFDEEVVVQWPNKQKKNVQACLAKVLKFSNNKQELVDHARRYIEHNGVMPTPKEMGRGRRIKKRRILTSDEDSDSEDEENLEKERNKMVQRAKLNSQKKVQEKILNSIQPNTESENSSDKEENEIMGLRNQIEELKKDNKALNEKNKALHDAVETLRWVRHALPTLQDIQNFKQREVRELSPIHTSSPKKVSEEEDDIIFEKTSTESIKFGRRRVSLQRLQRCNNADARKYTMDLMSAVFDRQTMATHTLSGTVANCLNDVAPKPKLDEATVEDILEHVMKKFKVKRQDVKEAIKAKLNNEKKLLKRQSGKSQM